MSVRNGAPYVLEAVESILSQTMRDFEFIIVDDGSTDATRRIIRECMSRDGRIVLMEKPFTGLADSLNIGLRRARAPVIARMDADDVSLPERLRVQFSWLSRHTEVGVLGTGCRIIDAEGEFTGRRVSASGDRRSIIRCILRPGNSVPIIHPSVMMRADVALRAGGYSERMLVCEDTDLWLRVSAFSELHVIPDVLLLLRKHPGCVSIVRRPDQLLSSILAAACYWARRQGLPDPSRASDSEWEEFRGHAHAILEREGVYVADAARIRMASSAAGHRGVRRYLSLLEQLAADPSLWVSGVYKCRWRRALRQVTRLAEARAARLASPVDVCSDAM